MNTANTSYLAIFLRVLVRFAVGGLFGVMFAGGVGLVLRDRIALLAPLMYVPLIVLAPLALVIDLIRRGRLVRPRFALSIVAIFFVVCSAYATGFHFRSSGVAASSSQASAAQKTFRVLQWNVRWGGRNRETWDSICDAILATRADVILLSETPGQAEMDHLAARLGGSWRVVTDYRGDHRYKSATAVLAPVELRIESRREIPSGRTMAVSIASSQNSPPLRVMMVDGTSDPFSDRTRRLGAVADQVEAARGDGRPFDILAGDFNAISRSVGFDRLEGVGYTDVARLSRWRATWPRFLPIYDIDHVLLADARRPRTRTTVSHRWCDHLGQVIDVAW